MRFKFLALIVLCSALVFSGCLMARTYVVDKERLDQDLPGDTGFGQKPVAAPKKTRKLVVLELAEKGKKVPGAVVSDEETKTSEKTGTSRVVTESRDTVIVHESNFSFPGMATEGLTGQPPSEYTVQKDDTLQKIAKKFYGAFKYWTRIYDANRDTIKDPNFLKPGTVLKMPALAPDPVCAIDRDEP